MHLHLKLLTFRRFYLHMASQSPHQSKVCIFRIYLQLETGSLKFETICLIFLWLETEKLIPDLGMILAFHDTDVLAFQI